jgi:hypothetical protein
MEYHEETEFLVELETGFYEQVLFNRGIDIYAHMQSILKESRISKLVLFHLEHHLLLSNGHFGHKFPEPSERCLSSD